MSAAYNLKVHTPPPDSGGICLAVHDNESVCLRGKNVRKEFYVSECMGHMLNEAQILKGTMARSGHVEQVHLLKQVVRHFEKVACVR